MWKQDLKTLENNKQWDEAIALMETIINNDPHNMDAYIAINFLLMNLLVEEDYNESKHNTYAEKLKKYFDLSRVQFSHNANYLFCTGITAIMSEWYFGISHKEWAYMLQEAAHLEPNNILYQWGYYSSLDSEISNNKTIARPYAQLIINRDSRLFSELENRGSLGDYILDCMNNWAAKILDLYPYD